jgi:putative transposase
LSRPLRFSYPHAVHHVTLRCNNREFLFDEPAWSLFAQILQEARHRFRLALYQFCLMTNHVHLLFRVGRADTLSASMHWLGNTFSRRFNKARRRHGHLWEGRFRSTIVEAPSYFLRCMAYVDLNPVRAGIVGRPEDYPWSGHRALRDEDAEVLDLSPLYLALGSDAAARYRWYVEWLAEELGRPAVSLATAYFVGRGRFVQQMERRFGPAGGAGAFRRQSLGDGLVLSGPRPGRPARPK